MSKYTKMDVTLYIAVGDIVGQQEEMPDVIQVQIKIAGDKPPLSIVVLDGKVIIKQT